MLKPSKGKEESMVYTIDSLQDVVIPIARQYGVNSISVFGSYSKGSATHNSDVDFLVDKGAITSLFELSSFRLALEDALQIPVDLITTTSSDEAFLNMIRKDEVLLYQTA